MHPELFYVRSKCFSPIGKNKSAFTLVELLLVIGIIALLISVLLPALHTARASANSIVCMNNLRQLGIGAQMYMNSFRGILPWEGYAEGDRQVRHLGPWEEPSSWFNACPKYAGQKQYFEIQDRDIATNGADPIPKEGDRGIFICPVAHPAAGGFGNFQDVTVNGYFMLWGLEPNGVTSQRKTYWCYGYNTQLDGGIEDRNVSYRVTINTARLRRASETILLAEKIINPSELSPPYTGSIGQQEISWKEFTPRHHGGGYILFIDNHVSWFSRKEVLDAPKAPIQCNKQGLIWDPTL